MSGALVSKFSYISELQKNGQSPRVRPIMVAMKFSLKLELREIWNQWAPCDKAAGTPHGEIRKEN